MDRVVNGSSLNGEVRAIPSKSQAHRLLICSAIAQSAGRICCPAVNEDIEATAACLNALGADAHWVEGTYFVSPLAGKAKTVELDCGESGSTLRFLLPLTCALGKTAVFTGRGRLPQRPLKELCSALRKGGARISADMLPIKTGGQLQPGIYRLPGKVSSQYISGLMFALPLLDGDSVIELDGKAESEPYIEMTVSALELFGVSTERDGNKWLIRGKQRFISRGEIQVEGDWSNAAFWLCAGAVGKNPLSVSGLSVDSCQGDKAVVDILKRFGAQVKEEEGTFTACPSQLRGIEIDAANIPDLVPVLAVTAAAAVGETRFYNAGRLRMKESDRIAATAALLRALGAEAIETEDGLIVRGGSIGGGMVDSFGDHRIAMSAAVASCAAGKAVTIKNADVVSKSYPAFFADFESVGGEVSQNQ